MRLEKTTINHSLKALLAGLVLLLTGCLTATVGVVAVTTIDVVKDDRTFGKLIDDNVIEAHIFKDVVTDPTLDGSTHINATVVNGVVLLTGEVNSNEQKFRAAQIANAYQGVDQVVNQLELLGKTSLTSRSNDTLITAKVKTEFIRDKGIDSSDIKVVTERGIVYLLGIVEPDEGETAVNLAKQVGGVLRIVKIFMSPG
ncbi:MAG: BON domain-containing protein [Proteobacteria bacterium]|nr:BON domain-containing protein [Pseudomonadota bacterium]